MIKKGNYILCVDDDPDDCVLIGDALSHVDPEIKIQFHHTGDHAIEFLNEAKATHHLPKLIILDINMPGLTGKETFFHLRKDPEFNNVPVVIMSTDVRDPDLKEFEKNGTTVFKKPSDFLGYQQIAETISKSLLI